MCKVGDCIKETVTLCGRSSRGFVHFHKNILSVKFCGHNEIFRVRIRECSESEKNTHWSWWDYETKEFKFTNLHDFGVTVCFPDGVKWLEEAGKGKLLPVVVELMEQVR